MSGGKLVLAKVLVGLALALALVGVARGAWRGHMVRRSLDVRYRLAVAAVANGRPDEVRALAPRAAEEVWLADGARDRWSVVLVRAAAMRKDGAALLSLHETAPAAVAGDEEAACLAARGLMLAGDDAAARALIARWTSGGHPEWWLALEADIEIVRGRPERARERLARARLPGAADGGRLCRLALMWLARDPARAWALTEEGVAVAPARADLREVRAAILEAAGKPEAAEAELEAVVRANPADAAALDLLGELHRRAGRFDLAVATWRRAASPPAWLARKAAFLNAVALGGATPAPARGAETAEDRWLVALAAIRRGDWPAARDAFARDRGGARALAPHLFVALSWMVERRLAPAAERDRVRPGEIDGPTAHSFFERLAAWSKAPAAERAALLAVADAPAGPAIACLCAGWRSAGRSLLSGGQYERLPGWARFVIAEAERLAGRPDAALLALGASKGEPVVELARARALIAGPRPAEALPVLLALAASDEPAGRSARQLLDACRRPAAGAR